MAYIITGPFLATAVLCESANRDTSGALTITRIVDNIIVPAARQPAPKIRRFPGRGGGRAAADQTAPPTVELTLVVIFRSGEFQGPGKIAVQQISPSGIVAPPFFFPTLFQGEDHGAGVIAKVSLTIQEQGLHWFEVSLGGQAITRIPLRVGFQS